MISTKALIIIAKLLVCSFTHFYNLLECL